MSPLGATLATLLHLLPVQAAVSRAATPAATEGADAIVRLAEARARWNRALDSADWDRDAPAARIAAESISQDIVALAGTQGEARAQAASLLEELGADMLVGYVQNGAGTDVRLATAYLRRHDDVGMLTSVVGASATANTGPIAPAVQSLALSHRASVAPILASAMPSLQDYDRESACRASLSLPTSARTRVAAAVAASWSQDPVHVGPACAMLGSMVPAGRTRIAHWLQQLPIGVRTTLTTSGDTVPGWLLVAVVSLAGTEQQAIARNFAAPILAPGNNRAAPDYLWSSAIRGLIEQGAHLRWQHPIARELLARITTRFPSELDTIGLLRLRARDLAAGEQAIAILRNPHSSPEQLQAAIGIAGVSAGMDASGAIALRAHLVSLRQQVRAFGIAFVNPRGLDRWAEAVDRVAACRNARSCLAELLATGSDATAARAAYALGTRGLGSLTVAEARPLVRRLVVRPDAWLLAATMLSIERCPVNLRGLREVPHALASQEISSVTTPLLSELERTCTDAN